MLGFSPSFLLLLVDKWHMYSMGDVLILIGINGLIVFQQSLVQSNRCSKANKPYCAICFGYVLVKGNQRNQVFRKLRSAPLCLLIFYSALQVAQLWMRNNKLSFICLSCSYSSPLWSCLDRTLGLIWNRIFYRLLKLFNVLSLDDLVFIIWHHENTDTICWFGTATWWLWVVPRTKWSLS